VDQLLDKSDIVKCINTLRHRRCFNMIIALKYDYIIKETYYNINIEYRTVVHLGVMTRCRGLNISTGVRIK
jgi:hypothetical protein